MSINACEFISRVSFISGDETKYKTTSKDTSTVAVTGILNAVENVSLSTSTTTPKDSGTISFTEILNAVEKDALSTNQNTSSSDILSHENAVMSSLLIIMFLLLTVFVLISARFKPKNANTDDHVNNLLNCYYFFSRYINKHRYRTAVAVITLTACHVFIILFMVVEPTVLGPRVAGYGLILLTVSLATVNFIVVWIQFCVYKYRRGDLRIEIANVQPTTKMLLSRDKNNDIDEFQVTYSE